LNKNTKHIVITGATRGLGRALAEEFIKLGHRISGCGRSEKIINEMNSEFASIADFTSLDICSPENVTQWTNRIIEAYGVPDIVINNAAVLTKMQPFHKVEADVFDKIIDVNVKGTANVLRSFLPFAIDANKGFFINMSSGWGRFPVANVATYCASKGAVELLSASIAKELPDGVAMMTLSPGGINTDMTLDCSGSHNEKSLYPEEWAKLAVPQILNFDLSLNAKVLSFNKNCEICEFRKKV